MLIGLPRQVCQGQGQVDGIRVVFVALPGVGLPPRRILHQPEGSPGHAADDREGHQKAEDLRHQAIDLRGPAGAPHQVPQPGQQPLEGNDYHKDASEDK